MTLRRKLLLWYAAVLTVILVIFGMVMYTATRWVLIKTVDQSLQDTARQVVINTRTLLPSDMTAPGGVVVRLPELDIFRASGVIVQLWDVDNLTEPRLIGGSPNLGSFTQPLDGAALNEEAQLYRASSRMPEMLTTAQQQNGDWRVITRLLDIWGQPYALQAALSLNTVNMASQGLLVIIVASMTLGLLGTTAMGWSMANRTLKRIDAITSTAGQIAEAADLKNRVAYDGPMDEVGRLASVFNHMLSRIEHMFSVQQRFVADVSHELRTPLTAIRGNLDLIKRYGADADMLTDLDLEVTRMNRLVADLLMLAKADYGGISVNPQPTDLDTLVSEAYREARLVAKDRDLKIRIGDLDAVRANADSDRLKQLLANLLDNAIKFTPDGGTITVSLRREPCDAIIEVADTGIGISAEDQQRVFDRFFQADTSRVRAVGNNEGVGLGLSIAKWVADAHGGEINVFSTPGEGTTFTVRLPHLEPKIMHDMPTRRSLNALLRRPSPTGNVPGEGASLSPQALKHLPDKPASHTVSPPSHHSDRG